MPNTFGTPEHWHQRADEAREMAKGITDEDARRSMFEIAENYEKIAKRAEAKAVGIVLHPDGGLTRDDDA